MKKKFGKEHEDFVFYRMICGSSFSAASIHRELISYCNHYKISAPSYSWVRQCVWVLMPKCYLYNNRKESNK